MNDYRANVRRVMSQADKSRSPELGLKVGVPSIRRSLGRVPTLFMFAEQDAAILPATVRGVVDYTDAPYRELRIADSGHWVQTEAADQVNAAIMNFLTDEITVSSTAGLEFQEDD